MPAHPPCHCRLAIAAAMRLAPASKPTLPWLTHPSTLQSSTYLQNGQATVILPDDIPASLASVNGAELANSTVWLGCIVAQNAVMQGSLVVVLDGMDTAEQCCRACREWPDGECNVFNYCSEPSGCRCGVGGVRWLSVW